ncbi:helix-turn-helix domain-containing protein [Cellulosilyticum sp. I15G10I2]|uniref:helix-turn-helix domain-containing protein n=1 Tax=Cellulosilyticum sp. I15G10I2 TaxID=1892843 RepID=UPI00085C22A1|nr:AraC family transcriptional regulator [Cellulosilyticum sp. I15G10I2]
MQQSQNEYCDLIVSDIRHVIERGPNPNWHFKNISHPDHYVLALTIKGECLYRFNDMQYCLQTGDIIFFQKAQMHSVQSNHEKPWSFISTTFDIVFKNEYSKNMINGLDNILRSSDFAQMSVLFKELDHIWSGMNAYYLLKCRSIIMEILYIILSQKTQQGHSTPHAHTINDICDMILKNYSKNYSVEELAQAADLSYSHFSMIFKDITGFGVTQYQNQVKINKAKNLLLSGECNVTEVAEQVGFNNIFYFSHLFKKFTGVSPSEYLKR